MRLAWLLLVIPGVYAQSMFDPIKDLAISLGPENINLLLTFWISYLILNFAIKLTPIFGSDSAHNQGGSIAVAMAAATTYFVYITKFNFIGAIMPFIVFLVVGALILLISKLFGKTGGFKSGRLIVTGILMILISLTLMGSASLYTTAILGSTLSWLPETIFAIGIVLIMLGGVMTLGAPTGDSNITDSNILKAAGKPFGWLWSKTGKKLWNRVRGTPEEAPAPENQNSRTPTEQTPNPENTNLTEGVVAANSRNIYPALPEVKKLSELLSELYSKIENEVATVSDTIEKVKNFYDATDKISKQGYICSSLASICVLDIEDIVRLLRDASLWSRKYGSRFGMMSASLKHQAIEDYNQMRIDFNAHVERRKKLKSRFHITDNMKSTNINSKLFRGNKSLSEVLMEERDLSEDLTLLAEQIEHFSEFVIKMKQASNYLVSESKAITTVSYQTQKQIKDITSLSTKIIQISSNFGALQNQLNEVANNAHQNGAHLTHDVNQEGGAQHGVFTAKSGIAEELKL